VQQQLHAESVNSLQAQKAVEAADTMPFDVYLKEYLSPHRLGVKP
jgi:glutamate--cysteine ligase